jgi:hypothetical protein
MKWLPSKLRTWLPVGFVVAFVIALCVWSLSPDNFQQGNRGHNTGKQTPQETVQDISGEMVAHYTKVLAGFTGLLALVSILQIYFLSRSDKRAAEASEQAAKQFKILRRQADTAEKQLAIQGMQTDVLNVQKDVARDQFFAQHRPHLVVKDVYFSSADIFDEVTIEMVNAGQSLAMVTGGYVGLDFISDQREFKEGNGRDLGPLRNGGFKAGQFRPFGFRVSEVLQAKLRYLQNGGSYDPTTSTMVRDDVAQNIKGSFHVFGIIYYTDARGEEAYSPTYVSVFRRIWNRSLGAFERTGAWDEYAE